MAQYTPKTWTTGETITAAELNALEAAAAAAAVKTDADAAYDARGAATAAQTAAIAAAATDATTKASGAQSAAIAAAATDATTKANAAQAAAVQRANHTGTQSADTVIDGTTNKTYTATEKTKLAGVATGATANVVGAAGSGAGNALSANDPTTTNSRTPTAHTHPIADLTATGTRDATTFLRGDGTWSTTPAAAGAVDASTTTKGLVQLAGDLAGTATAPTVPGLANKVNSSTYTAGLAAKADYPAGGTDGQALVKAGTSTTWATVGGGGASTLTPTATKTAAYTAAVGDLAIMNVAGGATALTLPTAPADKAQVGFLAIGATTAAPLTVTRGGTDTLGASGATSVTVPLANEVTVYQYDAANTRWLAVANVKPLTALDGRYSATLGPSNGTNDWPAFQAALTAARTAGGGRVAGNPGQTYRLGTGELLIGSGTTLDLSGCTVIQTEGTNTRVLRNYGSTAVATATDGAMTTGSAVLTTSLAAQATIGQTVVVIGAGGNGGGPLVGNVSAVNTGAGTVTLTTMDKRPCLATATVSAAAVSLYTRDKDIKVVGGNWVTGTNLGPRTFGILYFRHIDGLVLDVDSASVGQAGSRFYGVGSCTNFWMRLKSIKTLGVGIQISGPAANGRLDYLAGSGGDDLFAITCGDYSNQQDTAGDVVGVTFGNIFALDTPGNIFKVIAGAGWLADAIKIDGGIYGTSTGAGKFGAFIGDDNFDTRTVGGTYGEFDLGLVAVKLPSYPIALISPAMKRLKATVRHTPQTGSTQQALALGGSQATTVETVELSGSVFGTTQGPVALNSTTASIGKLVLSDGLTGYRQAAPNSAANILAARIPLAPYIFGDTFARADSTTSLGSADSGQAWTTWAGVPGILGKRAYPTTATGTKAVLTGVADGYQEIQVYGLSSNNEAWFVFRGVDTSNYWRFGFQSGGSPAIGLQKITAGSATAVGNGATIQAVTYASGVRLGVLCKGNTITVLADDRILGVYTDSYLSTATLVGWQASSPSALFGPIYARSLVGGS